MHVTQTKNLVFYSYDVRCRFRSAIFLTILCSDILVRFFIQIDVPPSIHALYYSFLPNTHAPLNKRAPLGDFGNLIIVPGKIRNLPVEPHLPFWILLT